jgi:hypothetical protein
MRGQPNQAPFHSSKAQDDENQIPIGQTTAAIFNLALVAQWNWMQDDPNQDAKLILAPQADPALSESGQFLVANFTLAPTCRSDPIYMEQIAAAKSTLAPVIWETEEAGERRLTLGKPAAFVGAVRLKACPTITRQRLEIPRSSALTRHQFTDG